ncbi:MAG: nucleotidyltransferase domain-containing protein [Anaerolineales bacterium]|nr:nucleotidyltransferase domain-containing protein [Anaerolineales bacterium]
MTLKKRPSFFFKVKKPNSSGLMQVITDAAPNLNKVTPALIRAVADSIIEHFSPQQIILFGSQAQGEATYSSDVDLLVILDDHHQLAPQNFRERSRKLSDLFPYRSFGLDALVLTQTEIELLQQTNEGEWDLILDILANGKRLYECAIPTA